MEINWLKMWQELITASPHTPGSEPIKRYKAHARRGDERPDPLLDYILHFLDSRTTVLDIGAGGGRWTIPLAGKAGTVTAVEPDNEMLKVLRKNIKIAQGNIQIIPSSWEEAEIAPHDIAVCAHSMYSSPDLSSFVRKMEKHAPKACFMAVRLPPVDGVIGQLTKTIYGRLYDSANAVVAYNALYSMGIYASVLVENDIRRWVNDTLEEAFLRAKRHLHLETVNGYDGLIRETLEKRLTQSVEGYVWPDGMRSALLWWSPSNAAGYGYSPSDGAGD